MRIDEIPVKVAGDPPATGGSAPALLQELANMLQLLADTGEGGAIDLQSLLFTPADKSWLRERLGRGEVRITLDAGGESRYDETGIPGIWWVEHRNPNGAVTGEFLEVGRVPEIVPAHPDDVKSGLERLKFLILHPIF
jgi:HupH hydrogenase expression protein, C-terminal conserved region